MEDAVAGVTVSFVADPPLAARVKAIARADGVTPSQAAARAAAVGTLIPPSARRTCGRSSPKAMPKNNGSW
jgi:hypothetical protein